MDTTTVKVTTVKTKLSRKILIFASAATGLIIAGGIALAKAEEPEEIEIVETTTSTD